jgi:hypothetical protein
MSQPPSTQSVAVIRTNSGNSSGSQPCGLVVGSVDHRLTHNVCFGLYFHNANFGLIGKNVISSLDAYKLDIEIPRRFGVEQCVGETLGPGGVFRA